MDRKRFFDVLVVLSFLIAATPLVAQKSVDVGPTPVPHPYRIFEIGVVQMGDTATQGFGVSSGGVGLGRSVRTGGAQAIVASPPLLTEGLPNLAGRAFCVSNASYGQNVVGTCASTLFGTSRLPVIWQSGAVSQLPLPAGETLGDANDVNFSGTAVGSVNGGSLQRAVIYSGTSASVITQTTSNGSFFVSAFGINDGGRVVGNGIDPNNAARNVGMVFDIGSTAAFEVGALPGMNGALAFAVSEQGHVVGSSMLNQGAGMPYIWTQAGGITAIPLPTGTSQGSARGVNSLGWAVGTASSAFAIPFLYDGTNTYRLADLIPPGTGWDLSTNTSSSAMGISESRVIVGTGVLNGQVRGYVMVPVTGVVISGRILTADGRGIRDARVSLTGGMLPAVFHTQTGSMGYYSFTVSTGGTYTISVEAKRHTFSPPFRMVTPVFDVTDFNFTAEP